MSGKQFWKLLGELGASPLGHAFWWQFQNLETLFKPALPPAACFIFPYQIMVF